MKVLLLAGTSEARVLARALGTRRGLQVVASLSGATTRPLPLGVPTRVGGFGGEKSFADYLQAERIGAVIDATHPFASRISLRSAAICARRGIPYLQILRPPWLRGPDDRWILLAQEEDVAAHVSPSATVFLATGQQSVTRFAGLAGHRVFCRRTEAGNRPFPFRSGGYIVGRPPFSVEEEEEMFHRLRVDLLVARNSGGASGRAKLDAARRLNLPVLMIARPPQPRAERVETVEAALDWVDRL